MPEYEIEPEGCQCCGFETTEIKPYGMNRMFPNPGKKWLCNLCVETMAGNAYEYPEQYRHHGDVLKAICYVGNVILKEMRRMHAERR